MYRKVYIKGCINKIASNGYVNPERYLCEGVVF